MLATRLMEAGVDVSLDLWELQPGADLPAFMERNLARADRVLMVCTEKYVEKANAGTGGVGYEKMIVTAALMKNVDSTKVIPIVRQSGSRKIPTFLSSKVYIDLSHQDQFEFGFDELTRTLHGSPLFVKPAVGSNPFASNTPPPQKAGDPILAVMAFAVSEYESDPTTEYISYASMAAHAKQQSMSRLYFDQILKEAITQRLLQRVDDFILITQQGRNYALENKLG